MAKIRVYELARELDMESKDVAERARELGFEVKTASSGLDEESAELVRLSYQDAEPSAIPDTSQESPDADPGLPAEPTTETPQPAPAAPAPTEAEPAASKPAAPQEDVEEVSRLDAADGELGLVEVPEGVTVGELAEAMDVPVGPVVRNLIEMGQMAAADAPVPAAVLDDLAARFGFMVTVSKMQEEVAEVVSLRAEVHEDDKEADLAPRPAVVTIMGHVDHGKTQLLDTIRNANVVAGEAGGITQHIGAYQVDLPDGGKLTFVDTPGHEAFTSLRARGANVTDIVVLVVAANDGVMPQTVEAISHAKAAKVPIIIAINKMDLEEADPYTVRGQLTEYDLVTEDLGGETLSAEVSALTGDGIDNLLELIGLTAELEDLKANPNASASGIVIEANLDPQRGPLGSVIVQRGTLKVGNSLVSGPVYGRVRALIDDQGNQIKQAPPSTPVQIMGWGGVPDAGDRFEVVKSDKIARRQAEAREAELRSQNLVVPTAAERMAGLLEELRTAGDAELRLIIKADVHGSLEAIREKVNQIGREGGKIVLVHSLVGGISERDVVLAEASEALIMGFNVRPDSNARKAAEERGVDIRTYDIIYELLDEIEQLLVGKLAPEEVEELLGVAEVRDTFRAPRLGMVAGSYITEGEVSRNDRVRLVRDGVVVYNGQIASLRRFKDDVQSVATGFECGIGLSNFRDIKVGDILEAYRVREVART
ncbi:MAG: translation initiation factor IF-2 [Acidimicrobiia bacterium]|nr:translation initiation factor IF-2 [Acidimicrobiia bacterium]NNL27351.1 translation initiation factor IF-2 [Acidimicrobiia bacterium]